MPFGCRPKIVESRPFARHSKCFVVQLAGNSPVTRSQTMPPRLPRERVVVASAGLTARNAAKSSSWSKSSAHNPAGHLPEINRDVEFARRQREPIRRCLRRLEWPLRVSDRRHFRAADARHEKRIRAEQTGHAIQSRRFVVHHFAPW